MHRPYPKLLLSSLLLLLVCACAPPRADLDLLDLRQMPQEAGAYLLAETRDLPLWPNQSELAADYLARHFSPWDDMEPQPREKAFWMEAWFGQRVVYGENLLPVEPGRFEALLADADKERYPSLDLPGVTVRPTHCRALPTRRPFFQDPTRAGEGFPFDYLQNSAIPPNTPLRIRHRSTDGGWVYAETGALHGWLPAEDVAQIDPPLIARMRSLPQAVLVRDAVPVFDAAGAFRFTARQGTFLPLIAREEGGYRVLLATAGPDGVATLREALLEEGAAAPFPLEGTPARIAALADRMLGQSYAWGDQYGDRDCSSMVRDLYAPFGIWLPRNSSRQAATGRFLTLEDLSPQEKEGALLKEGRPWGTLVWLNGHIMLYVGEYRGRAAVMHALWGVRTRSDEGRDARRIVGRTVITTLQPGKELPDFSAEGDLLKRVRGIAFPGERRDAP